MAHSLTERDDTRVAVVCRWVMSSDPKQQLRIQRFMVAAINYGIFGGLLCYMAATGRVAQSAALQLIAFMVLSETTIYVLLRGGFTQNWNDPSLTLPQILLALAAAIWSYAILGDSRGAALILLALTLTFGMFNLPPRATRQAAVFALTLLGATMIGLHLSNPTRHPASQEVIHFLFACTSLPTISLLSAQLAELRHRLETRKRELTEALDRIQTLATRDELTGLFNRRHMTETLHAQRALTERTGQPFCLALIDLDHFKQINDAHGHGVGDEVLRQFADIARHSLRETDVLARWGGEEFLLVLPASQLPSARTSLDRLHEAVRRSHLAPTVPALDVRFSAGLTEQRPGEPLEATIERADLALYEAKRQGRDQTVTG